MDIHSFTKLINQLTVGQITEDEDPNNILLQKFNTPYEEVYYRDAVIVTKASPNPTYTWGDGTYTTVNDSNGNPYKVPNCGWWWGFGRTW